MRHPIVYLFAAVIAAACFSASADEPSGLGCDTNAMKRVVVGPRPTADLLYAHLHEVDMGAWDEGFSEETFTYIGEVHVQGGKTYKIGYLRTKWGQACRATNRLYIFNGESRPLGHYDGVIIDPRKVTISGSSVRLPLDPKDGNTLDLTNGPPDQAQLDGDYLDWTPAEPKPAPDSGTAPKVSEQTPRGGYATSPATLPATPAGPPALSLRGRSPHAARPPDPGTAPPPPDPGTAPPPPDPGTAPPPPDPGTAPPPPDPGTAPPPPDSEN